LQRPIRVCEGYPDTIDGNARRAGGVLVQQQQHARRAIHISRWLWHTQLKRVKVPDGPAPTVFATHDASSPTPRRLGCPRTRPDLALRTTALTVTDFAEIIASDLSGLGAHSQRCRAADLAKQR
jgi:hypothetical protein